MRVFREIDSLPEFTNSVITVGSFDGVHIGHQKILRRIHQLSRETKGESIVITFHPHPRQVIFPKDNSLSLLSTLEEKIALLERFNVDNVVVVPFSVEFSQQLPREYVEKFLLEKFNPRYIVIGYDHQFGKNRMGDIQLLKEYEESRNLKVIEIPKQEIEDIAISSTKIREAVAHADFETAYGYLDYHYILSGTVIKGKQIGQSIGYPTANLDIDNKHKLIPPFGIYACYAIISGDKYKGMLYIGIKPSIKGQHEPVIEVNIFDFNGSIYGEFIQIEVVKFLRKDKKYEALSELKEQLHTDKVDALQALEDAESRLMSSAPINICILNYNGQEFLESYLPSVLYSSEKYDFEISIADNASTDDSIAFVNEYYPEINCTVFTKNYGFAAGYNRALENIHSKYTVILNSDVKTSSNWLDPIIELMESDPLIAACQPKVLSLDNPREFEYAGAGGGYMDVLNYPFCRGRVFDHIEEDQEQYNDTREVFWASGAAMVVRTSLFKYMGGFDGDYIAHQEEIDLCWRLKRAGYKIMYCGNSVIYHLGGGTLSYDHPNKVYLNFRNNISTMIKNETWLSILWKLPMRLILDGLAGLLFLTKGKIKNMWAVVRAHFSVYGGLGKLLKKRREIKNLIKEKRIGPPNNVGKLDIILPFRSYLLGQNSTQKFLR